MLKLQTELNIVSVIAATTVLFSLRTAPHGSISAEGCWSWPTMTAHVARPLTKARLTLCDDRMTSNCNEMIRQWMYDQLAFTRVQDGAHDADVQPLYLPERINTRYKQFQHCQWRTGLYETKCMLSSNSINQFIGPEILAHTATVLSYNMAFMGHV